MNKNSTSSPTVSKTIGFETWDVGLRDRFPHLCYRLEAFNRHLRNFLTVGNPNALSDDDGGFPRVVKVAFDEQTAVKHEEKVRAFLASKKGMREDPPTLTYTAELTIDYGNTYLETRTFAFGKDDETAIFQEIEDKSLYLFRSLYGRRRGKR